MANPEARQFLVENNEGVTPPASEQGGPAIQGPEVTNSEGVTASGQQEANYRPVVNESGRAVAQGIASEQSAAGTLQPEQPVLKPVHGSGMYKEGAELMRKKREEQDNLPKAA